MDSHLYTGYEVPPYYDSLLGKLIVWGPDRETAIARGRVALDELVVDGLVTNVAIHQALLGNEAFLEGQYDHEPARPAWAAPRSWRPPRERDGPPLPVSRTCVHGVPSRQHVGSPAGRILAA